MKTNGWVASSQRFYRWLLRLYPQGYRSNYEEEMFHLFTDQCREVSKQQRSSGRLFLWLRTLADFGVTVVREHLSDSNARAGLLDAAPNKPLPWKGVLLVLIPGLIFFVSQVEQVTSNNDWFFLAFYRAGYFLILPVLLVWLLTRRFPVWGLIPLGLLYETLENYTHRPFLGNLPLIGHFFDYETVVLVGTKINTYDLKILLVVSTCVILLGTFIQYNVRQGQISRSAWKWLGLYGLLAVLKITGGIYQYMSWDGQYWLQTAQPIDFVKYLVPLSLGYLYESLPFLLLIFVGVLLSRQHGGFTFLVLLGYLLPTIVFGRYGNDQIIPFYTVSIVVLVYRFFVALVAPVWLARAASVPGKQRAAVIPVAIAIACHISLSLIVYLAWANKFGYPTDLLNLALGIWDQFVIAAGLGLAVALYLPKVEDQAAVSPPALVAATE